VLGLLDDPLEREADRVAERVMRMPASRVSISPGPLQVSRRCASCKDEEDGRIVQTKPADSTAVGGGDVPGVVHEALRKPGQPLDVASRSFFEPRFGRDFSRVRVHTGGLAAESARALDALAYTVGDQIVFADGQSQRRGLLAHELAHVVQQSGAAPVVRRFAMCRHLLDVPDNERTPVPEASVQAAIAGQIASLGTVERELPLPAGSAAPWRTDQGGSRGHVIDPQVIGPGIRGQVDLAVLTGNALEVIEVKQATWGSNGVLFAEQQVLNYVKKGNRSIGEVERLWRNRGHPADTISSVRAMQTSRWSPETPQRIGGNVVSLSWCRDGVLSFAAVGSRDQDVFVCGVNDQGRIDGFLNRAIDPAQAAAERFISREIEAVATRRLGSLSLRDLLRRAMSVPQIRNLLPPVARDQLVDALAEQLAPVESEIRALARSFLQRVMAELRRRVQAQIRTLLTEAMAAVCAKTAQMTMKELLESFEKGMKQRTLELLPVVVEAVAAAMLAELRAAFAAALIEVLQQLAAAIVIVIVAILLWEVAAAIAAIEGIGAALVGIGAFLARLLTQLFPAFA
jgi:hypothetical protein